MTRGGPWQAVKRWWEGTFVLYDNPPNSAAFFVGGNYRRHWTARVARAVVGFLRAEWKWVVGVIIAMTGLALGYLRLS